MAPNVLRMCSNWACSDMIKVNKKNPDFTLANFMKSCKQNHFQNSLSVGSTSDWCFVCLVKVIMRHHIIIIVGREWTHLRWASTPHAGGVNMRLVACINNTQSWAHSSSPTSLPPSPPYEPQVNLWLFWGLEVGVCEPGFDMGLDLNCPALMTLYGIKYLVKQIASMQIIICKNLKFS